MISNVQQQCFDGVVNKMLKHETSNVCINNNNTNKNKNIGVMPPPAGALHNQDPNGFDLISPFAIHSSENAKEYVTPASQNNQGGGFTSLLDEISELIESHPTGTEINRESAFNKNSDSSDKKEHISQAILRVKKPSSRDEHHRNAFRLIEDVHNYSKLNRSDESTNSSSPDDEDFEEEEEDSVDGGKKIEMLQSPKILKDDSSVRGNLLDSPEKAPEFTQVPEEDEEKTAPEHHARRPMNAFLIFCKRHRAIVREKYKHLENRSITKILGEWWASLDPEEKISYTNLAKQYKDAFFSANPNFKWYKLPAPPLRTLSTRPSNIDRPISNSNYTITNSYELSNTSRDRMSRAPAHYENESDDEAGGVTASEVGVFKLADEAQMGGLSSLMTNSDISGSNASSTQKGDYGVNTNAAIIVDSAAESLSQLPLNKNEPFENMKEYAAQVNSHQELNGKRKIIDDGSMNGCKRQMLFIENNISSGEEDILGKKSERSCKGKKYQELMNSGQIITFTKKSKSKCDTYSSTLSPNGYLPPRDNCTTHPTATKSKLEHNSSGDSHKTNSVNLESPVKQFDASDFDLEEKIKALPAQSLEEYLARKRETKKKKKINSRRYKPRRNSNKDSPKTIQEAKEQIQMQMVGSQKRKARKESITRREINSMTIPNDGQSHVFDTVELWNSTIIKTEPEEITDEVCTNPTESTSDLLILAEVATNHIEDKA